MSARICVVTVATGDGADLVRTLAGVEGTLGATPFESIVVANGVAVEQRTLPSTCNAVKLLASERVAAPAILLNAALAAARAEFVAFFVAGTVPEDDWQLGVFAAFERPDVAAVVARILDASGGRVRTCGAGMHNGRFAYVNAGSPRDAIVVLRPGLLDLAPLCGMVLRRSCVATIGGYDAGFAASLFDFDWSIRARLNGFVTLYRPDVRVRFDGPLPFGHDVAERPSAQHFLARWQRTFEPNLDPGAFLP